MVFGGERVPTFLGGCRGVSYPRGMLQSVEVLPGARRALRRAVSLDCRVVSDLWDEPVPQVATDLSPYGMWLRTEYPLEPGSEVVVAFTPPGEPRDREVLLFGTVRRAALGRRRSDPGGAGMGVAFEYLDEETVAQLCGKLRGLPPPLPRSKPRRELVWVDTLLTCEEADGTVVDVSARLDDLGDEELSLAPLGELVTGSVDAPWTPRFLC